jgi:hypothetical protein
MRPKEKIQRSLWPDLRNGLALFAISLPFSVVTVIKLIYNASRASDLTSGIGDGIAGIYEKSNFLKFMWPVSPNPNMETAFTWGNLMGLAVIASSVVGLAWMSRAYHNFFRLQDAKHKAEEQQLIDDYKK